MADDFVHLHVHSEYSLLDGLGRIKNLVKEAKRLGQPALALTDHGVMHGAVEFFRACKEQGIRPLIGVEAYQTVYGRNMGGRDAQLDKENYHLLLLARNMTGYRNLLKIATRSQLEGYYYYRPRVDHDFLASHADGLFCTTGCLGAEVPQLLSQGKEKEAYDRLGWYVDVFGRENFAIELQEHSIPELVQVNKTLVPWADKFGLQLVVTNDVHYVREEDGGPHDVLLCVQTGVQISQQNRMRMSDGSYFLKSREQMEATFRPFIDLPPSAYEHTLRIAEMCEVDLEDPSYHLPDLPVPEGFTYETYLRHLTEEGLQRLYGEHATDPVVQERKERELKTIHEMGFDVYYLIVADLCNFARRSNIWWNVRGSGAGSLVAYCVGITGIDPLKNNLIFERFLNPGRVTMPDFDLDFPDDQREAMIRYTVEKFGESQVAQIATFNRMKAKAAVRDVGRAQGIDLPLVDKIAKLIPGIPGKPVTIQDCLTAGHEFYSQELVDLYAKEAWVKNLLDTAMKLEGVARNAGIHAAAVIVADRELEHYTPLMRGSKSTVTSTIAQYEFPILESIGLLKVDFLGLSTLSVMREAARLIAERHGIEYRLDSIPYEGEAAKDAFTLLSSGEVSGVFQVESAGMRRTLIEMKPSLFEHIVAMISLYRPGPMEYIPTFIQRMHGKESVEYKHPKLEPILNETYGICVSGDSIVTDARTGRRYRLDEVGSIDEMLIQGVDEQWRPAVGRVTHWIDSGIKPVFRLQLRNGMHVKVTADHRLLTEDGWQPLSALQAGGRVATMPEAQPALNVAWEEIASIELVDDEHVYDLTVEGLHSFVANNIVVHNCVYQEQIIQILSAMAGYTPGEADLVRRAIGKKKASEIEKHKKIFIAGCEKNGIDGQIAADIYGDIEFFARYGFNKCLPGDVEVLDAATGRLVKVEELYRNPDLVRSTLTCDTASLKLQAGAVSAVMNNGVKPVYRLITALGRQIEATANHPFYTFDGWRLLEELRPGNQIAIPRQIPVEGKVEWPDSEVIALADDLALAGGTTTENQIPAPVFELTNRQIGLLISRMWEGDGHIDLNRRSLFYDTSSERMARQLQHLLLRIGIMSCMQEIRTPAHVEHATALLTRERNPVSANPLSAESARRRQSVSSELPCTTYQLSITGNANLALFRRHIASRFVSAANRALLDQLLADSATDSADSRLADDSRYAESDLYWDRIISIEYVGEKQTYDLEVPGTHNFVANDILVHNSHAADYAVITVQTAFLKAHYPVEYMAAQLLVERDKTEKVVNFVSECRRMGIDVLPPDVNYSGLDFEIQQRPPETPTMAHRDPSLGYPFPVPEGAAIRFGMAAIKNVGEGPVQAILDARTEGGPFRSLEEFCDRVDLRRVGKRPLECLIKAGALDRFGLRSQLLAVLDQMVAQSAAVHDARDSGQLSMFDLLGGSGNAHVTPINLPTVEEVKGREKLAWEKELLGVYSISHPLLQLDVDLKKVTSCSCAELDERYDGKGVTLAGMISGVRVINTKKGDPMAFVQLEDLQGACEVVFFPKTYAEVKDKLQVDSVVIIKGKAQTREGETSLLAEVVQTHFDKVVTIADEPSTYQTALLAGSPTINGMAFGDSGFPGGTWEDDAMGSFGEPRFAEPAFIGPDDAPFPVEMPEWLNDGAAPPPLMPEPVQAPASAAAAPSADDSDEDGDDGETGGEPGEALPGLPVVSAALPPAHANGHSKGSSKCNGAGPSNGSNGKHPTSSAALPGTAAPSTALPSLAAEPGAEPAAEPAAEPPAQPEPQPQPGTATGDDAPPARVQENAAAYAEPSQPQPAQPRPAPPAAQPAPPPATGAPRRKLIITLRRTGDLERDKYRLREIYDTVRDPRGRDAFCIRIVSSGKKAELAFPNDGCTITDRLQSDLKKHFRVDVEVE